MRLLVCAFDFRLGNAGVNLRCVQQHMTEQPLNLRDIRAAFEHVRCARVAEHMRRYALADARKPGVVPDDLIDPCGCEAALTVADEQGAFVPVGPGKEAADVAHVFGKIFSGLLAQWNNPVFAALAAVDAKVSVKQVNVMNGQVTEFRNADPGRVKDFHDGPVPDSGRQGSIGRIEKFPHFGAGKNGARQIPFEFRHVNADSRVHQDFALVVKELVEPPHGA